MKVFVLIAFLSLACVFVDGWRRHYYCPKEIMVFGNADPHLGFKLKGIERHVCFDLHGKPGDIYFLYGVPGNVNVTTRLIKAPHSHNGSESTYFGSFTFVTPEMALTVTPKNVSFVTTNDTGFIEWPHSVSHKVLLEMAPQNFQLIHFKRKVLIFDFGGNTFFVQRNMRKYKNHKRDKLRQVNYLGIYAVPKNDTDYTGLLGEFINENGQLNDATNEVLYHGHSVRVVDHSILDMLHHRYIRCWYLPDVHEFLSKPVNHYKLN